MNQIVQDAINSVQKGETAFCKFISANDAGTTGAHQAGLYIPKNSIPLMFDKPGIKGENKDRFVRIKWQSDFETDSRFIYYGQGTRNEYRLTRFGKNFPFLDDENVGDLLILVHINNDYYEGFVLSHDEDIEEFFATFNISPNETNRLIDRKITVSTEDKLLQCFLTFLEKITTEFPTTIDLATTARNCYKNAHNISANQIQSNPDGELLKWIETEYQLFKTIENELYKDKIKTGFSTVEELVEFANSILNRRKSRAGKSLEHHLSEIFSVCNLSFDTQVITEGKKRPDFIFPGASFYHNLNFDKNKLVFLASKTTCKDRWRQIINEAGNIKTKHLFTLQQGISQNQLNEMYEENVCLVVPKPYLDTFPKTYREKILPLNTFIQYVQEKQK